MARISVRSLFWDDFNREHIADHDVHQDEVEHVVRSRVIVEEGYAGRLRVVGKTHPAG